jgi:hypothetical protein
VTDEDAHWSIQRRLAVFFERLRGQAQPETADEALRQICDVLTAVEDELTGIPAQSPPPDLSNRDGRMYPPLVDHTMVLEDGGILAMTRGHRIEIATNGHVRIVNRVSGIVEFER